MVQLWNNVHSCCKIGCFFKSLHPGEQNFLLYWMKISYTHSCQWATCAQIRNKCTISFSNSSIKNEKDPYTEIHPSVFGTAVLSGAEDSPSGTTVFRFAFYAWKSPTALGELVYPKAIGLTLSHLYVFSAFLCMCFVRKWVVDIICLRSWIINSLETKSLYTLIGREILLCACQSNISTTKHLFILPSMLVWTRNYVDLYL